MVRFGAVAAALLLSGSVMAQTRTVSGQAGLLAEWDLTATVTEQADGRWSGPLTWRHVGFCSVDGPEEKSGALSLRIASGTVNATISLDGDTCTFSGSLTDGHDGALHCPNRRDMPMMLTWE